MAKPMAELPKSQLPASFGSESTLHWRPSRRRGLPSLLLATVVGAALGADSDSPSSQTPLPPAHNSEESKPTVVPRVIVRGPRQRAPGNKASAAAPATPTEETVDQNPDDRTQIRAPGEGVKTQVLGADAAGDSSHSESALPKKRTANVGLAGRGPAARAELVKNRGGSSESEDSVARGLAWLAAHQRSDGSWRFNHQDGPCRGLCADPGTAGSTTAATGLALLPFLAAGETEKGSPHKAIVEKGLYYLTTRLVVTPRGGDLQEGTMYGQGIAALALCEAYAMTGDESLQFPTQKAIDFICSAQHAGGGWRYAPGTPGDTTVTGWQLMALKSAHLAGLNVPRSHSYLATRFLDSVQSEKGACYGYMKTGKQPTPTAVGLLLRMYLGWKHDDPRLAQGVDYLQRLGPSPTDVYFNFYATQVLHHYGGAGWSKWNEKLRDRLVAAQGRHGHEHGSWYFPDQHGQAGGRLYTTAMCLLTLEVYYRYMPLYGERPVAEEF